MNPIFRALASLSFATLTASPMLAQDVKSDAMRLAACCNQFAADLHRQLATGGAPTAGPASIDFALLMLVPGARAATLDELRTLLHLPEDLRGERLAAAAKQLLTDCGLGAAVKPDKANLRLVNSIWAQRGHQFVPAYMATLQRAFGAEHHLVDFIGATAAARDAINADVAAATNQRIKELITPDLLTPETRLVLTNAMWFKAAWQHAFPEHSTHDGPFTRADGSQVKVPMMRLGEHLRCVDGDAWQAIELPFVDSPVCFEAVVPKPGSDLVAVEQALLTDALRPTMTAEQVLLTLPRFRIASKHRLKEALIAMGLKLSFTSRADFSGIDANEPLCIDEVVHQAWVNVDEAGAEAAAATAVVMKRAGAARKFTTLKFDRPFAFALRDSRTGLVLFFGRVDDPSKAPPQ